MVTEGESGLEPFVHFCQLFYYFSHAADNQGPNRIQSFLSQSDTHPKESRHRSKQSHDLQQADFLLTHQWMQIVLWKLAMFEGTSKQTSRSPDDDLSISFPERVARNVMMHLVKFPQGTIEAHGLGMVSCQS